MQLYYVLQSKTDKDKIYIGYSNDLRRRLKEHNSKDNRGYTKGHQWSLVYNEGYLSEKEAHFREKRLKQDGRI
jgi:putative endonuclease